MLHSLRLARKLVLTLICCELLLVVAYGTDAWIQGPEGQLHEFINLDGEGNLPTWFSSFQLSLIAITLWRLASLSRPNTRPSRRFFRFCSGFFMFLSADETAMMHERITASIGSRYIDWLPKYVSHHPMEAAVTLLVLLICARSIYPQVQGMRRISKQALVFAAIGCAIYLTGAAVLETVGYRMLEAGVSTNLYRVEVAGEEFLEMLGASLILYAVLLFNSLTPSAVPRRAGDSAQEISTFIRAPPQRAGARD